MIILHASFDDGQLYLWGEQSVERSPTGWKSDRSPYDPGPDNLIAAARAVLPSLSTGDCADGTLWIPGTGAPLPSDPLIDGSRHTPVRTWLKSWRITTLPLQSSDAAMLAGLPDQQPLAAGVAAGGSLLYARQVARFAAALVARQQVIPSVEKTGKAFRAAWLPVLSGQEGPRFATLVRAMPGAARALSSGGEVPDIAAAAVLRCWLRMLCDHYLRSGSPPSHVSGVSGSVHDAWLSALFSKTGVLDHPAASELAEQISEWRRPYTLSEQLPFRLVFRLEEPVLRQESAEPLPDPAEDPPWHVSYLLQSLDDPSLLLPGRDAWQPRALTGVLRSTGAQEYLLAALGRASRLAPEIADSLRGAAPEGYDLTTEGAHQFLTERAWMLQAGGFGVLLPSWWSGKNRARLSARATVRSPLMTSDAGLSLESLLEVDWHIALGGEPITARDLEQLALQKSGLVQVRGRWVELNPDEILAALDFWKKRQGKRITAMDALHLALGQDESAGRVETDALDATGWISEVIERLRHPAAVELSAVPVEVRAALRPYQQRGFSWLLFLQRWGLGGCLADDMGLGKTLQVLSLIQKLRCAGEDRPFLVIAPTSVLANWQREAERFTPELKLLVHHGAGRSKDAQFSSIAREHAVVLSSFALLHRDAARFHSVEWSGVILDEAQNIKNPETRQARAARSLQAPFRAALTGTPVENHIGDLWSIMEFLNPGLLGTQSAFRRNFFLPIQTQRDPDALQRLKKRVEPFILRRLKTDREIIQDLPEKWEMKIYCPLTREQASLYQALVREIEQALQSAEGIRRRGLVLSMLVRLKQICNHPAQYLNDGSPLPQRSGKLTRLTEMLEEALESGDRSLIFTQFAEMGEMLRKHLQETFAQEVLFLHGGVTRKRRDDMVQRFQSGAGPRIFVLSLKAGGTGLNLTAANQVFHYDRWWNPSVENQATDRAFRIGQKKNVQVHKFLCAGTLEERIEGLIESKKELSESVVGSGEGWLTELSTAELRQLVELGQEALAD